MKNLLTAAALIAVTATVLHAQTPPINRSQEYRIWSAEQLIDRLIVGICQNKPLQPCKEIAIKTYPKLNKIRQIAADGDDVQWAKIIEDAHAHE